MRSVLYLLLVLGSRETNLTFKSGTDDGERAQGRRDNKYTKVMGKKGLFFK